MMKKLYGDTSKPLSIACPPVLTPPFLPLFKGRGGGVKYAAMCIILNVALCRVFLSYLPHISERFK
jgi:hypothetical protein